MSSSESTPTPTHAHTVWTMSYTCIYEYHEDDTVGHLMWYYSISWKGQSGSVFPTSRRSCKHWLYAHASYAIRKLFFNVLVAYSYHHQGVILLLSEYVSLSLFPDDGSCMLLKHWKNSFPITWLLFARPSSCYSTCTYVCTRNVADITLYTHAYMWQ